MSRMLLFSNWQRLAGHRRIFILCLLLFLVSAIVSVWFFFPVNALQRRLLQEVSQQTGLEMRGGNATMLFPLGVGLDLTIYPEIEGLNDLELKQLQISPVWSSLFSADQQVHLHGTLAGGMIDVDAAKSGGINMQFQDIPITALQQENLPYRMSGKISGQVVGENISPQMRGRGHFSLNLKGVQLIGLEKIGLPANFTAGTLILQGKFDQRRFSLEKAVLTQGDLEFTGGGNILVGESSTQTRLNLNVRLHPTATTPDSVLELFNLTGIRPTADGSYLMRIGGTLAKPIIR